MSIQDREYLHLRSEQVLIEGSIKQYKIGKKVLAVSGLISLIFEGIGLVTGDLFIVTSNLFLLAVYCIIYRHCNKQQEDLADTSEMVNERLAQIRAERPDIAARYC